MLSAGLGIQGFSWAASPACTELETIVMNWMGKMIGLSDKFLPFQESEGDLKSNIGGGVILVCTFLVNAISIWHNRVMFYIIIGLGE